MNIVVVFLVTYVVVLIFALIVTAVFCPRNSRFVSFKDMAPATAMATTVYVGITMLVSLLVIYVWGCLYYPTHCHSCGEPITGAYYSVDKWRWHPGCFTENAVYHSTEIPSWQFPAEQEAPNAPTVVNSSVGAENTIERISGTVEGAQVKFNQGE